MVGIVDAAAAAYPEADRKAVSRWFAMVARSGAYLEALAEDGAQRHDLDAAPIGPVTEEHRKHARATLQRRRGWRSAA